jgi:hypothetical protein
MNITNTFGRWLLTTRGLSCIIVVAFIFLCFLLGKIWRDTQSFEYPTTSKVPKWVEFNTEMFKTGLQAAAIGVLGGAAKVFYDRYQEQRGKRERRREDQRKFLNALVDAYQRTKQCRRLIRARMFRVLDNQVETVRPRIYDEVMKDVSLCQLALEALVRQLESATDSQFPHCQRLREELTTMEVFLGGVISEWEVQMPKLRTSEARVLRSELTQLNELICHKGHKGPFGRQFVEPYKTVHDLISRAIQDGHDGFHDQQKRTQSTPSMTASYEAETS